MASAKAVLRKSLGRFCKQTTVCYTARTQPDPAMASTRSSHADSRLPKVLDEAARLFRSKGFEGTSVRDIARAVGMLPGSLYCHFETKEALLVAVYVKGVQQITDSVSAAAAG